MAVWYEMEKSEKGIKDFLESNWEFHDFRIERVTYTSEKDCLDIFLKYDTMKEGVLLRFAWTHDIHIAPTDFYACAWLGGSVVVRLNNDSDSVIWLSDDGWGDESSEHLDELKKYTTWVEAERVFWAITDADGNPVEMPEDRIHQIWRSYDVETEKHFDLKPFEGDWEEILHPFYER